MGGTGHLRVSAERHEGSKNQKPMTKSRLLVPSARPKKIRDPPDQSPYIYT